MQQTQIVKGIAGEILRGSDCYPFGICNFEDLAGLLPCRAAQRLPKGAKSVLVCLFPYYTGEHPERNISRYAMVTDYHLIAGEYLRRFCQRLCEEFGQNSFEPFTDNSPIPEVQAAFLAGLGQRGKNGLLLHPDFGSYVFIGEVVTDLALDADKPVSPPECIGCNRCLRACPQGALQPDGRVELSRCRSHLTQKKGELSQWEKEQIRSGGLIWGCDICNDVCPYNRAPKLSPVPEFLASAIPVFDQQTAQELLKTRAYNYRGKKTILRNIALLEEETNDEQ